MFCGGVLHVAGGGVLAEGACASLVLCHVLRVRVPVLDWDCVRVSLCSIGGVCDKLDSLVHHKKVLLDSAGRVRCRAANGSITIVSLTTSGFNRTELRVPD